MSAGEGRREEVGVVYREREIEGWRQGVSERGREEGRE